MKEDADKRLVSPYAVVGCWQLTTWLLYPDLGYRNTGWFPPIETTQSDFIHWLSCHCSLLLNCSNPFDLFFCHLSSTFSLQWFYFSVFYLHVLLFSLSVDSFIVFQMWIRPLSIAVHIHNRLSLEVILFYCWMISTAEPERLNCTTWLQISVHHQD